MGGSLMDGQAPWWALAAAMVAGASLSALVLAYRHVRSLTATLDRVRQREASWKVRFDDVFERSGEIVVSHDHQGRITALNRSGERVTGYARDEIRIVDPEWIFSQDYLDAVRRLLTEGPDSPPRTFRAEILPRKGGRVPIEVQARVVADQGVVIGVTTIARDLTDHQRLESELRQAQKMEAVGRLATGIAHDFNNLITVLLGYSDDLMARAAHDESLRKPVEEIRHAAERASGLTQQLLAFSRRQGTTPQTIDINLAIANMEELLRRLLGADIRMAFELDPELGHIHADPAQVSQVVMNLAVNARDAMPKGGTLTVETANVTFGAERLDAIPGPHVMLAVRDTGVGMSDEVRARLFEPFFTTKEVGQGTGIGLSMVQAIVRQNTGHLEVESVEGRGSTFRVFFPRVADLPAPAMPMALATPTVHGTGVVLLAEDDESVRGLVVSELTRRGFTVLEAADGREAFEVAEGHRGPIDVLVTDIVMPRMSGTELAVALEGVRPDMRTLYITGHVDRADEEGPVSQNVLMKPFTADQLAARITETMGQSRG
jgi:two-component system, cell cycle sensor histidine kinase and response regulator CckA